MSKTEIWVIQRNDGYFYWDWDYMDKYPYEIKGKFTKDINKVILNNNFWYKAGCKQQIKQMQLQNCVPVKVKIEIVGEDDE